MKRFTLALALLVLSSAAYAQTGHVVDPASIAAGVAGHAADRDANRDAIREALGRSEVRELAGKTGIDLNRAASTVDTLNDADLERVGSAARDVNRALVGGANSITLSTTTIIIILLLVILIVVAAK